MRHSGELCHPDFPTILLTIRLEAADRSGRRRTDTEVGSLGQRLREIFPVRHEHWNFNR
jgi:hypothetical protein